METIYNEPIMSIFWINIQLKSYITFLLPIEISLQFNLALSRPKPGANTFYLFIHFFFVGLGNSLIANVVLRILASNANFYDCYCLLSLHSFAIYLCIHFVWLAAGFRLEQAE